jgi:hypothetical protein
MNIFQKVEGWFKKEDENVDKLFTRIEPLIVKAEPIVKELAVVATGLAGGSPLMAAVSGFLSKSVPVASEVEAFVSANQTAPVSSILHNAATLALQHVSGSAATTISDLDTAVQIAYSATKQLAAAALAPVEIAAEPVAPSAPLA